MQRKPETTGEHTNSTLIQYKEVNAIFRNSPVDGTTTKERTIYVNETQKDNCPTIVTRSPTSPGRPVFFSEEDAYFMQFPHIDALVIMTHIGYCTVSNILVDRESSINILYDHTLARMDTPELPQKLIIPQTQSLLYGFDESEARSFSTVEFSICANPFNVVINSASLTSSPPIIPSSGGHESI